MKKLKFRTWDKYKKQFSDIQFSASFDNNGDVNVHYHCEINQFIDLLDINGKEVFEKDIVKIYCGVTKDIYDIGVVEWDEKYLCFSAKETKNNINRFYNFDFEVIGNFYENARMF